MQLLDRQAREAARARCEAATPDWRLKTRNAEVGAGIEIHAVVGHCEDPVGLFEGPSRNEVHFFLDNEGRLCANLMYERWVQFPEHASKVFGVDWREMQKANGAFAAHARQDLPRALDTIEALVDQMKDLAEASDAHDENPHDSDLESMYFHEWRCMLKLLAQLEEGGDASQDSP